MNILILSCDTGGGHNAAGFAVLEELRRRGHNAWMEDPFRLSQKKIARHVGSAYVKLVQTRPKLFGLLYRLGMLVTKLPFRSPVYYANKRMNRLMAAYFQEHPVDVVITPHLFPAEILTSMKKKGISCPKSIFIATDYACIPFTEETDCDYYVIPHSSLTGNYIKRGIPPEKLRPLGIPVRSAFLSSPAREQAREKLGLPAEAVCCLVMGGSMGAGKVKTLVKTLLLHKKETEHIIVICGKNDALRHTLEQRYGMIPGISILGVTNQIALYMRACNLLYSKPGGLTSTEAAVTGIPLVHTSPIPGCETANRKFFQKNGISVSVRGARRQAALGKKLLRQPQAIQTMIRRQNICIPMDAAQKICDLAEGST